MKKILLAFALLLACAFQGQAQSTTVSGQVTDVGSQPWNNGTIQFQFIQTPNYSGSYVWTGGPFTGATLVGALNATGAYSVSVPSNTAITPSQTQWRIQICSATNSPICFTQTQSIVGATQTINLTPPAILIPPVAGATAYADTEISPAIVGSHYYNLVNQVDRVCQTATSTTCTLWVNSGSSGSGSAGLILPVGVDSGAVNAYVVTTNPAVTLTSGQAFTWQVANANTGASTINVDGLGVLSLNTEGTGNNGILPAGNAMTGGELLTGVTYVTYYDGTRWRVAHSFTGFASVQGSTVDYSRGINFINGAQLSLRSIPMNSVAQDRSQLIFYCVPISNGCVTGQFAQMGFDGDGVLVLSAGGGGAYGIVAPWESFNATQLFGDGTIAETILGVDDNAHSLHTAGVDFFIRDRNALVRYEVDSQGLTTEATCSTASCTNGPQNGAFTISAAATTQTISTSGVNANSQIFVSRQDSLGARLSVTCNTQSSLVLGTPRVTSITAGTSFVVTVDIAPTTNPLCFTWKVIN